MNIIPGDDSMTFEREVHRGEIFYMLNKTVTGSEQSGGRPVIIVSNEACNQYSPICTVVCLTTQEKKPLPTHVLLEDETLPVYGTILCEQIQCVSKLKLGNYVGEVSEKTMKQIEKAIAIQLDITQKAQVVVETPKAVEKIVEVQTDNTRIEELEAELRQRDIEIVQLQERARVFRELFRECYKTSIKGGN